MSLFRSWKQSLFGVALGAFIASGCASTSQITVRSTSRTNDGNTLYMMVRAVDRVDAAEDYQSVASRLFANPPDSSVISSQPIFPGQPIEVKLDDADKRNIVIYFFFTDHGANWRVPLRKPLPSEVFIDLGNQQIERIQVKRR
ncbi:MAG: hypothetical protein U0165_12170 [Polyangiaceae bacterium]